MSSFVRPRTFVLLALAMTAVLVPTACTSDVQGAAQPGSVEVGSSGSVPSSEVPATPGTPGGYDDSVDYDPVLYDPDLPELEDLLEPEWQPESRTEELRVQIQQRLDAGDEPTLQQAVDAFDLTYLDLPGATPSELPDGDGLGQSYVMGLIGAVRDQLSEEQQAVLDSLDETEGDPIVVGGRASATAPGPAGQAAPTAFQLTQYRTALEKTVAAWKAYQADFPVFAVQMSFHPTNIKIKGGASAGMDAGFHDSSMQQCDIRVFPVLWNKTESDETLQLFFAHELFHCRQQVWSFSHAGVPDWVIEGGAEFAALDLWRNTNAPNPEDTFDTWFTKTSMPLSARSYGAWGLFEAYRDSGGDVYGAMQTLVKGGGGSVESMLTAAGMKSSIFQLQWNTRTSRPESVSDPDWSLQWPAPDPSIGNKNNLKSVPQRGIGAFKVGGSGHFSHLTKFAHWSSAVGLTTVIPAGGPAATHGDSGTITMPEGLPTRFCFDTGKCKCPDGTGTDAIPMSGTDMLFAFPAQEKAVVAQVVNEKWDPKKHCKKKKEPKRGQANGDPHLLSYDGSAFDVQSLAEFVTTRDPAGDFEVQSRHLTFRGAAAGTSAVAIRAGEHRVTLTTSTLEPDAPITVRLDGTELAAPFSAGDVQVVSPDPFSWRLAWPDGSRVEVRWGLGFFINVELSPDRGPKMVGLLGSADNNMFNDQVLPDGTPVPPGADLETGFAEPWRVDGTTSLFDYEPGESFETFRKPIPEEPEPDLTEGLAACQESLGVSATAAELESCAFDVAISGEDSFTEHYQVVTIDRLEDTGLTSYPGVELPTGSTNPVDPSSPAFPPGAISPPVAGAPSLTLSGTLTYNGGQEGDALNGLLHVPEGAVVLLKAASCQPDIPVWVYFTRSDGKFGAGPMVCDSTGIGAYNADDDDEVVTGESYLIFTQGGDFRVALSGGATDPTFSSVDIYVDPTPTVVSPEELAETGWSGTLSGIGDSVVLRAISGESSKNWAVTGLDQACYVEGYGSEDIGEGVSWDLGYACKHAETLGLGPTDTVLLFVLFNRTATDVPISVVPE